MKTYIQNLNKMTSLAMSKYIRNRDRTARAVFEPLETQIMRWWANLPEETRNRPFQVTEIAGVCRGRYRERPATREVAATLRSLGWTEYRDWTAEGRNRRLWKPKNKL